MPFADNIFANLIDRGLADDVLNHDFDDGIVDFASQWLELELDTGDFELGRTWHVGRMGTVRPFAGLRLAHQKEVANTYYSNFEGAELYEYQLGQSSSLDAWGFRLGGEGRFLFGRSGFGVFGRSSLSLLLADYHLYREDRAISPLEEQYRVFNQRYSTVLPVAELAAGVSYSCGRWFVSAGYEITNWFDMYQQLEVRGWDDVDGATTPLIVNRRDLSLDGWFLKAGLGW